VTRVNRVVVTGLGAVTPLGLTLGSYWENLKQGVSGIAPIETIPDAAQLSQKVAAEVRGFDPLQHFEDRALSTLDRVSQIAVVAAREAIAQSGLVFDMPLSVRTASIIGTGAGGQATVDENFRRIYIEKKTRVFPLTVPKLMVNAPASQVSMQCGLRGPAHRRPMPSDWRFRCCAPASSIVPSPAAPKPVSRSAQCAPGKPCG
jgi:nodulation protein E